IGPASGGPPSRCWSMQPGAGWRESSSPGGNEDACPDRAKSGWGEGDPAAVGQAVEVLKDDAQVSTHAQLAGWAPHRQPGAGGHKEVFQPPPSSLAGRHSTSSADVITEF